jgi:hypothetical protein
MSFDGQVAESSRVPHNNIVRDSAYIERIRGMIVLGPLPFFFLNLSSLCVAGSSSAYIS